MITETELNEARKIIADHLAFLHPHMTPKQIERATDHIMKDDGVQRSLVESGVVVWRGAPIVPTAHINRIVSADPTLAQAAPSVADIVAARVEEGVRVHGEMKRAEIAINAQREVEAMTIDQRIETGIKPSPQAVKAAHEGTEDNAPCHRWADNDQRWRAEFAARGLDMHKLLPSQIASYMRAIRDDSRKASTGGNLHPTDQARLASINAKDPNTLSPEDRIAQHRLTAHN